MRVSIEYIKRRAKKIKRLFDVQHSFALDLAAQESGYSNYAHARRALGTEGLGRKVDK